MIDYYKQDLGDFMVTNSMLNYLNILHGGELVKHLDSVLGLFAQSYNQTKVVTGTIEKIIFNKRSNVGDRINFTASLIKTTSHTMTIYAAINHLSLTNKKMQIGEALFIFIAVDDDFKVLPVKQLEVSKSKHKEFIDDILKRFNL